MAEMKVKKEKDRRWKKKGDPGNDPRAPRYYMVEKKGGGMRYYYRARKREESEDDVNVSMIKNGQKYIKIAWQQYFFNEGELSHPSQWYPVRSLVPTTPPPFVKHVNFTQTVGMPERFFEIDSEIICLDPAGRPLDAVIRGIEKSYYHVVYNDKATSGEISYEWIHRNSSRLKPKPAKNEDVKNISNLFDLLKVGMYVKAQYPDGKLARARILQKHIEEKYSRLDHITVLFEGNRLSQQKTFSRREVNDPELRLVVVPDAKNLEAANKTMHYISALKAIYLNVAPMTKEGGHSMFRALSYQLFGTETNWKAVRRMCIDHLVKHKNYFQHFVDCEFEEYIAAKTKAITSKDFYAPGDHLDLQAICEIFDVGVRIYSDKAAQPFYHISFYADDNSIFQEEKWNLGRILLFYRGCEEYDALVEIGKHIPLKRQIGFQKTLKSLGELSDNEIKGFIIKERQRQFMNNNPHLFKEEKKHLEVGVWEGEWCYNQENSTEKTVSALLKRFRFRRQDWDVKALTISTENDTLTLSLKIDAIERQPQDPEKILRRKFLITGAAHGENNALELVNFCEEYFDGLEMIQTKAAVLGRTTKKGKRRN